MPITISLTKTSWYGAHRTIILLTRHSTKPLSKYLSLQLQIKTAVRQDSSEKASVQWMKVNKNLKTGQRTQRISFQGRVQPQMGHPCHPLPHQGPRTVFEEGMERV